MLTLCVASPLYAKTAAHSTAKSAATKVVKTAHRSSNSTTPYLQCVVFARQFTGMQIFGDAWTWWEKAAGKYDEGHAPKPGAVLVFPSQGRMKLGHVAVVSQIITDRYIQVTHANWSPVNGHRGRVETNVNVMDVSDKGDWSQVKVWFGPLNDLGTTVYKTSGFIYNTSPKAQVPGGAVRQGCGHRTGQRQYPRCRDDAGCACRAGRTAGRSQGRAHPGQQPGLPRRQAGPGVCQGRRRLRRPHRGATQSRGRIQAGRAGVGPP
ncbi:MAG: CHAP domain-containing protein [Asticcacaulis sp.]